MTERTRTLGTTSPKELQAVLGFIVYLVVTGLVVSFIARGLVSDEDPMPVGPATVLGLAGSVVGGLFGYALTHHDAQDGVLQPSGILGSIVGGAVALFVYRAVTGGRRRHVA